MIDKIFESFLERQVKDGLALARSSDLFELVPMDPLHYVTVFNCKGLVQSAGGEIEVREQFTAGIYFSPDHLRKLRPGEVVTWLSPGNVWHPNIRTPYVCIGRMTAGVGLVELVYQLHEIITLRRFTAHDALNPEAAAWANRNRHILPVDNRPLRRAALALQFRETEAMT